MTGGDILWATRRGFWVTSMSLRDKDFPVPKDWRALARCSLTEAAKVVETGSQGGGKGVKILFFPTTFCWMYCYP